MSISFISNASVAITATASSFTPPVRQVQRRPRPYNPSYHYYYHRPCPCARPSTKVFASTIRSEPSSSPSSSKVPSNPISSSSTPQQQHQQQAQPIISETANLDGSSSKPILKISTSFPSTNINDSLTSNNDLQTPPVTPPSPPLWPRLLALFVAAVFGTNFPVVKFLQSGLDPLPPGIAALARFSLASSVLLPVIVPELLRSRKKMSLNLIINGSVIGIPVFLGYLAQSLSLAGTEAGKSAFLCSLAVVFVPLIEPLLRMVSSAPPSNIKETEKSLLSKFGAPLIAVLGVALLELSDSSSAPNIGDAFGLLQAIAFGLGFILNERAASQFPSFPLTISALQLSTVSAFSLIWAMVENHGLSIPSISSAFSSVDNSFGLLYAGLISTALTVVLANISLSKVTAGELTVLLSTEPVWAAVFASLTLGETMGTGTAGGALLILAACLLNQADILSGDKKSGNIKNENTNSNQWVKSFGAPAVKFTAFVSSVQDFFNKLQPPFS